MMMLPLHLIYEPVSVVDAAECFLLAKYAGWGDPPDETGALEGTFAAPLEVVLEALRHVAQHMAQQQLAYTIFSQTIRGEYRSAKDALEQGRWKTSRLLESLLQRMAVLGGPVQLDTLEAPPATAESVDAVMIMIRSEQELSEALRHLGALLGENPMHAVVQCWAKETQEQTDALWRCVPHHEHPAILQEQHGARLNAVAPAALAPTTKTAAAREQAVERAHANLAAESVRNRAHRGNRWGAVAGQMLGMLGGGAAGHAALPGLGSLGGSFLGGEVGRRIGSAVGTEIDTVRRKHAAVRLQQAFDKLAEEPRDTGVSYIVPPTPPDPTNIPPQQYLQREAMAQQAQDATEASFYRERLMQAAQQMQMLQQQMQAAQQQLTGLQQQTEMAGQQIQASQQQAMAAHDEAAQQAQQTANARMALQNFRMSILNMASQEPQPMGTPVDQQATQLPTDGEVAPTVEEGPANQAAQAAAPPSAAQPGGPINQAPAGPVPAEGSNVVLSPGIKLSMAYQQLTKQADGQTLDRMRAALTRAAGWLSSDRGSDPKNYSNRLISETGFRLPLLGAGAGVGALLGAGRGAYQLMRGEDKLQQRIRETKAEEPSTARDLQAARLHAELAEMRHRKAHPWRTMAKNVSGGAALGAVAPAALAMMGGPLSYLKTVVDNFSGPVSVAERLKAIPGEGLPELIAAAAASAS